MRTCRICGCTDSKPCVDDAGMACAWIELDLCDFCAGYVSTGMAELDDDPRVELYSESQANAYLRARAAGVAS